MKKSLLVLFSCLVCYIVYPQADSTQFIRYLEKGQKNQGDSAIAYFELAQEHVRTGAEQQKLDYHWALHYFLENRYEDSFNRMSSALTITDMDSLDGTQLYFIAKSYYLASYMEFYRNEIEESYNWLTKTVEVLERDFPDNVLLHACYTMLGNRRYANAYKWINKGLAFAVKNNMYFEQLKSYGNLGVWYADQNKVTLAQDHFRLIFRLLDEHPEAFDNTPESIRISTHNNIGDAYTIRLMYDSANYHFRKALRILDGIPSKDVQLKSYEGTITFNIAATHMEFQAYDSAIYFGKKSVAAIKEAYQSDDPSILRPISLLGLAYQLSGDHDKAFFYRQKMLSLCKKLDGNVPQAYSELGSHFVALGALETATKYYDSAFAISFAEDKIDLGGVEYWSIFDLLKGKSTLMLKRPSIDRTEVKGLHDDMIRSLDLYYSSNENKIVVKNATAAIENLYLAYAQLFERDASTEWLGKMWELAETNKSIKLRSQLRDEYSLNYSLPSDILEREKELSDSINMRIGKIAPSQFDSTLFKLKGKYERFIRELENDYPAYYALKRQIGTVSLQEAQMSLGEDELLLNFFEGEDNVFLFKVDRNSTTQVQIKKQVLDSLINTFNDAIITGGSVSTVSKAIQEKLQLSSELEEISRLTCIPDGIIWKLSFGALMQELDGDAGYLGNRIPITFDYFARKGFLPSGLAEHSVLAFSFNEKEDIEKPTSYFALRDLDESIPGTSKEVSAIASLWSGDYFYADQASETAFKNKSTDYRILHLAVHGFQDEIFPENSFLQFSNRDSVNDGRLYAYEIYNLDLKADMAVLSACNSGDGKIVTGEGMMSMGRAFSYAGVNSLLASRWEVPDASAPYLMKYFYVGLKKGMKKSEALKYAQVQFLENDAYNITSAPLYWAGFYVLGNDQPIKNPDRNRLGWFALIVATLALTYLLKRKKDQSIT